MYLCYLQVEQGKLLPNGDIDPATVDWVKSTAIPDKTDEAKAIRLGSAGFKRMNLDLVLAKTNQLITGIRFVKSESNGTAGGASISLEAQMTTFETKEGEISLKAEGKFYVCDFFMSLLFLCRYLSIFVSF